MFIFKLQILGFENDKFGDDITKVSKYVIARFVIFREEPYAISRGTICARNQFYNVSLYCE